METGVIREFLLGLIFLFILPIKPKDIYIFDPIDQLIERSNGFYNQKMRQLQANLDFFRKFCPRHHH